MLLRSIRTGIILTATVTAAIGLYVFTTLPPPTIELDVPAPPTHVAGAYHVHTDRSDGTGTLDEIALAASRAGVEFVVLTDHGDATRPLEPPAYRNDVLMIDAVEINTREGHVVALGLPTASPYPLAGPASAVIEDIHRMGGIAIAAHPDSPRTELAWRGGERAAQDGYEWLNVDSEWRDEGALDLMLTTAHAVFRAPESLASMFTRPERSLRRWDAAARIRHTVGLAAVDAHANIPWRDQEEPRRSAGIERPSYETMFRTLTQVVVLDAPLSRRADRDATAVLGALAAGRTYSVVRAQGWPAALEFSAERGNETLRPGDRLEESETPLTFVGAVLQAPGARLTLLRDGQPHRTGRGSLTVPDVRAPGVYRLEAHLPGQPVPWVVSNPITVTELGGNAGGRGGRGEAERTGAIVAWPVDLASTQWSVERDPRSNGALELVADGLRLTYTLGPGAARGQYAALAYAPAIEDGLETVSFTAHAGQPTRLSVQVRLPEGRGRSGQRWRTSIFVDEQPRTFTLRLQDLEPADRPTVRRPIVTPIQSLLFVIDTVNARPGTTGSVTVSNVELGINRLTDASN